MVDASHQCMTTRGIHKTESGTITSRMLGAFRDNPETRSEFIISSIVPKISKNYRIKINIIFIYV